MWRQRSKILWLQVGDQNIRYFQNKASLRFRKNHIARIQDDEGRWHSGDNPNRVIIDYFEKLFFSSIDKVNHSLLEVIPNCVIDSMHRMLDEDFTQEKVLNVIQQMHPTRH